MAPKSSRESNPEGKAGKHPTGRWERFVRTRRGKTVAWILAAILLGVSGFIAAQVTGVLESTKDRIFSGPALSVRIVPTGEFIAAHPYAPFYVVPDRQVRGPAGLSEAATQNLISGDDWEQQHGGVAGSPQVVRLELRAKSDEPVIVEAIRVNVVRAARPISGWFVARPGCGIQPVRLVSLNLDASPATVTYLDASGRPAGALALRVGRTEPEVLEFHASTAHATVAWTAEVLFSGPDGGDSVEISDEGTPFQVTSATASEGYRSVPGQAGDFSLRREPAWDDGIDAC